MDWLPIVMRQGPSHDGIINHVHHPCLLLNTHYNASNMHLGQEIEMYGINIISN